MDTHEGAADASLDELIDATDELLALWDRWIHAGSIDLRPRPEFQWSQRRAAAVVTLTQHLVALIETIRPHLPADLPITLTPVARAALETGVWLVWLDRHPDSIDAAINEAERTRGVIASELVKSGLVPESEAKEMPGWTPLPTEVADHARRFKAMTDDLELDEIYVIYRMFSGQAHPGARVVDAYLESDDNGGPVFRAEAKIGFEAVLSTRVLPLFLLKATRIVTHLTRDRAQRSEVRAIGRKIGVSVDDLFSAWPVL